MFVQWRNSLKRHHVHCLRGTSRLSGECATRKLHSLPGQTQSDRVIFSGIQPTGIPHLGNYLGALQQWVHLQNTATPDTKLLYSIVDLHAITIFQDPQLLKRWKRETLATLLAIGLDPARSILFYQSSVRGVYSVPRHLLLTKSDTCALRTDVDSKLHFLHGIPVPYDPVEG